MMERIKESTGGAVGVGLVLVLLPSAALLFGSGLLDRHPATGLPILAVFGVMILFGALALTATLFARLSLSDRTQALALPEGSVRAAIALALVVLFAIVSIMLYQSIAEPYEIRELPLEAKDALVRDTSNRVLAVIPDPCVVDGRPVRCPEGSQRYTVHLRQPPGQESADLAKQLLILIGTLMTSVTSFYFASRAAGPATKEAMARLLAGGGSDEMPAAEREGVDVIDAQVLEPTSDEQLPAAGGGVARS